MKLSVSNKVTLARRSVLVASAGLLLQRSARAASETFSPAVQTALREFTGGAALREGRVLLVISPLVENGNTVPVSVSVESAMTEADHVRRIALFNTRNPQPEVASFAFGRLCGAAQVSTRMRLATSQTVLAVAQFSDGSFWQHSVDVIVTLAACVEGG
jgi:sulfur-oxidizing protein SoxY